LEKWEVTRIIKIIMEKKYLDKLRNLPHALNQFVGLISVTVVVILFFVTLNIFFGQGDELVKKMKIEEERIAKERKLSEALPI